MNTIELILSREEVSDLINGLDCLLHPSDKERDTIKPLYADGGIWQQRAEALLKQLIAAEFPTTNN